MIDPAKPLQDSQHERFACELAKGASQNEAYELSGFKPHTGNASRLRANESVSQRVLWLKTQAASDTVLTMAEKRRICAEIARDGENKDRLAAIKVDNDLAVEGAEAAANKAMEIIIRKL